MISLGWISASCCRRTSAADRRDLKRSRDVLDQGLRAGRSAGGQGRVSADGLTPGALRRRGA